MSPHEIAMFSAFLVSVGGLTPCQDFRFDDGSIRINPAAFPKMSTINPEIYSLLKEYFCE
jgi:hypothetical protein